MPLSSSIPKTSAGDSLAVDSNAPDTVSIDDGAGSITIDGTITANAGTGTFLVDNAVGQSVAVDDNGSSLTVDGTVTSNQGTANTIDNAWLIKITDGTNTAGVTLGSRLKSNFTEGAVTYCADSGLVNAATGGADNPILLIKNPNASGKTFKLVVRYYGTNVNNVNNVFKLFLDPTITANGTSLTIVHGTQSGSATVGTAFSLPTISANGTLIDTIIIPQNSAFAGTEDRLLLHLEPNHNWLLTSRPASNNREVDISVKWIEE